MNTKENKLFLTDEKIINKIYYIRNQKVMIDKDLAILYGVETRVLNQAVRRNIKRFPEDFMFQLNKDEFEDWKSQIVISNSESMGLRKLPLVFTEQGVAMLSGILNSERAINVNIQIMRIFAKFSRMLKDNLELKLEIEKIKSQLNKQDKNIKLVFTLLDKLIDKTNKPRKKLGFRLPDK